MAEVRGNFDILMDNLETIFNDFSDAQELIDSTYAFDVYKDYYRNYPVDRPGAYVFLSMGPMNQDTGKSASQAHYQYNADYYIDCVTNKPASSGDRGDEAAAARLRYLIKQVLDALHAAGKYDLNLPNGSISRRPMLGIDPLPPEMQMVERPIVGARITLTVGMAYAPELLEGTALESIHVDASRWQALYEYT